jgi:carbamoyltransferase
MADGWETLSVYEARGRLLTPIVKDLVADGQWLDRTEPGMPRYGSLGGMYSAVATQIFGDPMEAGKVMGLAPYGTPALPPEQFVRCVGSAMEFRTEVSDAFRGNDRWPARASEYADLAASVQKALEVALRSVVAEIRTRSPTPALCYAGGVALNCTANEMLWRESGFERVYVPPPAEDSGPAVGAAFHGLWELAGNHTTVHLRRDGLGRSYRASEVDMALAAVPGVRLAKADAGDVTAEAAALLSQGQVGGWFVEGAELGPRALGCRSIVADPRSATTRTRVNDEVKRREGFRPLAPAVLAECASDWFDNEGEQSPFMLRTWRFRPGKAQQVPAVVHVDGTGRVQTVERALQPRFHALLREFYRLTGVPMILNTSLNGPGEPIVETPIDALWCLLGLGLDFLVLENRIIEREAPGLDILDLTPTMACDSYSVRLARSTEDSTADGLTVVVSTPWGRCERPLPPRLAAVVSEVDNTSTGWEIQRRMETKTTTGSWRDRGTVRAALLLLARRGIVSLMQT